MNSGIRLAITIGIISGIAAECDLVFGVLPMLTPKSREHDLRAKHYIAGTFTKFLEQGGVDWVPLPIDEGQLAEFLPKVSGVFIPDGEDIFNSEKETNWYLTRVKIILEYAKNVEKERKLAVVSLGFGAQLVLKVLSDNSLALSNNSLTDFQFPLNWSVPEQSLFYRILPEQQMISKTNYPFSQLKTFLMEDVNKNDWFRNNAVALAQVNVPFYPDKPILSAFEVVKQNIFGFLFDVNRIQFFHDETYDIPKGLEAEDAAFTFSIGIRRLGLMSRKCSLDYDEILAEKRKWRWGYIRGFSAEFDDVFVI